MDLMRLLAGLLALVQAAEDFGLRPAMERERPWALTRGEVPFARAFDLLFAPRGITLLLALRVVAALALMLTPRPLDAVILIFGTWAWAVRWRGSFNGGSDAMTLIVLIGTLISLVNPKYDAVAAAYVAAHLITSFVVAGLVKLKNRDWRRGLAPATFLRDVGVTVSTPVAVTMAWSTMAFELSFPFSLAHPALAAGFTGVGVVFHVANAYLFGLNRFLLAWGAAYPALLYLGNAG